MKRDSKSIAKKLADGSRFYYGWIIVAVALISMAFWFGIRSSFSVYYVALLDEFGWSRGSSAGVQSMAMITYTIMAPLVGGLIDRFGPRAVLLADAVLIACVCLGYGFSYRIGHQGLAIWILYVCFVGDQLLFGANMARTTYLSRIAVKPEHVAPTLSLGITINHAVSMSMPAIGGILWATFGHTSVFMAAAGVAVLMFAFSTLIRVNRA